MVALTQALLVACTLAAALGWTLFAWRAGLPLAGWAAGAALALAPHAPVLALQFALLVRHGRDDSAPPAGAGALLRAWAGELLAGWRVFGWRQPFRAAAEADVAGPPGRTGVLLLHGYCCNRGLWAPWLRALRGRGVAASAPSLAPMFGRIEDWLPAIDAAVAALAARSGRPPLLVCHSMGGLAARAWLAQGPRGQAHRVAGVLTIATPHHGTWLAHLGHSPNARQMRPGSAWLRTLAAREASLAREGLAARFTCFYGHADNIVFPTGTATLAGADNRHLPACAHVAMAFDDAPLAELLRQLAVLDGRHGPPDRAAPPVAAATAG